MRVLVMSYLFPRATSPWSGVFVAEQVAAVRALGVDARVLWGQNVDLSRRGGLLGEWSADPPLNVPAASFAYKVPPRTWQQLAGISYGRAALAAVHRLRKHFDFDLVHAHTSWLDGYAASLVKRTFGVPVLLTEHSGPFTTQVDNPIKRYGAKRALAGADRILAVSEHMRSRMVASFPSLAARTIEIVGNGFDPDKFTVRAPLDRDGEITAVWIGSFVPIKQPLMMLEAFAAARRQQPRLRLDIVGAGPMEAAMRGRSAELGLSGDTRWLGSLDRDGVAAAIGAARFLIVSSESETFSMVTLEALACGRPVVSTRCGGPESIIDTDHLGMLVESSVAGLSRGIAEMTASLHRFDPTHLRASAAARFANDVVARKLVAFYDDLHSREAA